MKTNLFIKIAIVSAVMTLASCDKEEEETPTPVTPPAASAPATINPAGSDAFGALIALQTANYIAVPFLGEINQPVNTGVAVFGNLSGGTYVDAGNVTINTKALTKQTNNYYIYTPAATDPLGPDLSDNVTWNVTGNSGNSVPALNNVIPSQSFPVAPKYDGVTSIPRNAAFTVSSTILITGADTTYFSLFSPTTSLQKRVAGDVQSVTFTAEEMATLGAGTGYVQIAPYSMSSQTFDGKKIYFVNESVVTKSVTFN